MRSDTAESDLLHAIQYGDDFARLVYADWLDEQGDKRGQLIRLMEAVRGDTGKDGTPDADTWSALEQCITESLGVECDTRSLTDLLNERDQRLFACDCAERVLPLFESKYPNDARLRNAITVSRRFALGSASYAELARVRSAARDAARDAAWDARWAAERTAKWDTARSDRWNAGWNAANTAANTAARTAANAAARNVRGSAGDSEGRWQIIRLIEYRLGFA